MHSKAKFMLVTKAYESLTNEEAKKNYELYGNPDGRGSMRFSIGLPSFILNKKNHLKIIIVFLFIVCILLPYYFLKWYNISQNFDENGILSLTSEYFMKNTDSNTKMKNLPFILGTSHEFMWIEDYNIDKQINEINELFNKYKSEFPEGEDVQKIINILQLRTKKAIAIAYAYSYGERENQN